MIGINKQLLYIIGITIILALLALSYSPVVIGVVANFVWSG